MIAPLRAPIALRMPISLVRSVTVTNMMLAIPSAPTNSATPATETVNNSSRSTNLLIWSSCATIAVVSPKGGVGKTTLTILLDMTPETAVERKAVDRDRYERDLAMQARVRDSYRRQAREQNWILLDGERGKVDDTEGGRHHNFVIADAYRFGDHRGQPFGDLLHCQTFMRQQNHSRPFYQALFRCTLP